MLHVLIASLEEMYKVLELGKGQDKRKAIIAEMLRKLVVASSPHGSDDDDNDEL